MLEGLVDWQLSSLVMGNSNQRPMVESEDSDSETSNDRVKESETQTDQVEESSLQKKVEDLQSVVSRRNKQIKELKVKLGKRERDLERLEKDIEDERLRTGKCERMSYEFESRVKALEANLLWWEGKDREQRRAAEEIERRKQEDMEIERRVRFEEEIRESQTRSGEVKIG